MAKTITSPAALATSPDLASELAKHISQAVRRGDPILMGPVFAEIQKFCSYKREAANSHILISFLQLRAASMKIRDVAQFVRVFEQKLIGAPSKRQLSGDMLFAHHWQNTPVGCGFSIGLQFQKTSRTSEDHTGAVA